MLQFMLGFGIPMVWDWKLGIDASHENLKAKYSTGHQEPSPKSQTLRKPRVRPYSIHQQNVATPDCGLVGWAPEITVDWPATPWDPQFGVSAYISQWHQQCVPRRPGHLYTARPNHLPRPTKIEFHRSIS